METGGRGTPDEWRLGIEAGGPEEFERPEAEPRTVRDYSAERLERPLCVVTAEYLGWAVVGLFAVASRLVMLGARPLDSTEASHALSQLALVHGGLKPGVHPTWIDLLQAAVFGAFGAGDFRARIVFALGGLLLVGVGFAMRRHIGRAGGLAFAALLALSPGVAFFSRGGYAIVPALALAVLALAIFLETAHRPSRLGAAGLGVAIGLGLAADSAAIMTAIFMLVALAAVAIARLATGRHVKLQVRVWWTRRKTLLLITAAVAAAIWLAGESGLAVRSPLGAIAGAFRSNLTGPGSSGFMAGLNFYLPMLSLYEFLAVLLAVIGAIGVVTMRIRSWLAAAALVWSAAATAFYLWTPARMPVFVLQMIVPMSLLGAFALDYLHHRAAWSFVRYPLAVLAVLTLYVQVANNFVRYAPDAGQAPWARTALLYWSAPATTLQTPVECARAMGHLGATGASAFYAVDSPVIRWYLRGLAPAPSAADASAIIAAAKGAGLPKAEITARYEFELSDVWHPRWRALSAARALHYFFDARAWAPLESRRATIVVRPTEPNVPTVIFAPGASPDLEDQSGKASSGKPR